MSEQLDKLRKLTSRTWLNSGNSSAIVNESKDDEPGFLESAWGNFKGGAEGAISGIANFAGANLKALADNPYLNKWLSAKGLEAQGQAITNNGYNGPNLYQPVTESNLTPYKETIQKNADALLNEGAYLDTLAQDNIRKYGSRDSYGGLWDRVSNFDYWTDPRGAIADISQGVGSTLPSLAASVVIPGAGAAKIGGTVTKGIDLLSGITGKKLASAAIGKGAESVVNHTIKWGVGGGLTEAVSDAGSIYNDLKEQGYSDVDIANTINKLAINEAPYLMASDALTGALITGKMGSALKKNKYLGGNDWYKKIARNIMTGVPLNMAGEYITEMKQQQLQKEYTNKPYGTLFNPMSDEEQAGAMGAIGALGFAGIGGIRGGINRTYNALVKNKVNNTNANNISIPKGIENADAWKAATIAANDVGRPDLAKAIYSQWALESGRFSADNAVRTNNFGGLKDPNTSENRLQRFDSIEEFAHEYARQTLKNYDLNKIREGNIGDFSHVLKENGYYGASEEKYTSDLESIASEIEDSTNSISLPDKKYYNILGEVSDTGLTTLTEQKLNLLARDFYNKFGYNLDVTSMKRNGDGSSWHDSGQAIDVANDLLASDPEARAWLIKQGEKYGLTSLDEYTNPSANATGGHIHFSDHGEPIPGVSTQVDSAPSIDNSTANDFYNNDSYVLNNDYSNMKADDISFYEPAQAEHKTEKNDNSDLDTLSEDEKWDIVDEEIAKAQTDGNILYLDKLTKIKRNNDIHALDNLIDNIKKTDKKFLTKLQAKRASNFTSEQQKKIDSAIQEQNKLYSENKTLEAAKKAEEIEHMKKGFMADNAFKANKNKDNKLKFDTNKLKILGNNLLKQLEKSNNELQNTNPIVNYDKIKASLDSSDINKQRDAITAIQYLLNASNNDKKTSKAMLLEGLNNPNNRIANDWYNKINDNLDINNIKTLQKDEISKKEITIDNTENINSYIKKLVDNLNSSQDTLSQEDINRLYDSIKNKSLVENQEQKYQYDYSIEQLAKSIERAKRYEEFINSLSEEEALAMDYLDYTFKDTGKSFVDVLNLLKNEQEQDIQNYMEILRSQMKKGVVARSVYYNEKTDEYINSPGFSNNYEWYRDIMKARDYRPLGKNDIEGYLRDTAIEHLSYGYEDPQYGMQIPPEVANEFRRREDAINGLETIADKAKQYEQGRQLSRENQTSSRSNETNIQQKQREIDIEAAKNIGKLLFDKVQEKQLKVDLNNLEQAISSDNINRVNKANDFMQRKLEPILNDKEKQQIQKTLDDNKIEADIKKEDLSTSEIQSIENNSEQSDINRSSFDLKTNVSSNNIILNDNISDNQKKSEVNENELNDSSNTVVARDKQGNNKDNVGKDDESHQSSREDGRDIRTNGGEGPQQDSSTSIRGDSTNIGGKTSDSTIRQEKSANTDNSTRDTKLSRSVTDSYERPLVDETTTEGITDFVNESLFDESTIDKQKQINTKDIKVGNLESIKNDLPLLLPEQQDDVFKAETRMFVNNKPGMLFTNGTGTGKTFTGLGIVKRFVEQGKKNILIVSPSTGINDGWIDSGKKFGLNIVSLKNKKDNGNNNISITTLNNFTSNKTLVKRNWDLVVIDECHKLISNQNNKETGAIKNLRAITLNERGFNTRFDYLYPEENSNSELRIELKNQWKQIQEKDKPKVLFLSATPFSHVKNIDYAEGYLFNYDRQNGNLNTEEAHDKFFVKNFGYKIRYNRLEQPDPDVDNSIMEMEFHEKLKNDGAISSRRLVIDKDYDRGFILVDGGIGKKVDEGFEYLFNSKNNYTNLANFLNKSYGYYNKLFLLEAVKAREAIKLIKEYKKTGKKIVVFHRYLKNESKHPFKLSFDDEQFKSLTSYTKNRIKDEYEKFCKERPDLVNLDLSELTSPIQTLTEAFGDKIAIYNGSLSAKEKNDSLSKFNDDNSEVDVILVQADAGSAGISLHDKTGKHQRVLINLGLPTKPVEAIQTEGRIYRVGQKTNAIFRYLNTGTSMERTAFATNIAQRSETVENLALGEEARNLKQSFVEAFQETIDSDEWKKNLPGNSSEGTGGKEKDYANQNIKTAYDKAKTFYYANQKKTSKNKSSEGKDYFATPEPIGLKMVKWSRLKDGESALEPSAGHGAIARWFPATTKNVAIEPSSQLADLTRMSFNGKVRDIPFENLDTINKFDAVIMNPPFGQGGKTAIEHVAKAFKHLRDGGRIVAIIPNGPACQKHFDKWYASEEATSAILIKEIILPGIAFNKAGTSISTKVVIIDKQTTKEGQQATKINVSTSLDLSHIKNINELFDTIENLEIVDRVNPYNIEYSLDGSTDDKEKNEINVNNDIDSESYVKKDDSSINDEVSSEENTVKEHDDEKSVMEIVMENEEYFDQVIKQINPYYEVPKDKETINKLKEKEDAIAKKREILKNFNSVRTGAMLSERADRYIFTIRNPLILELTAQYESADLDKIFHDLAIKNNGRDENIHYGSDKGEFYSWFKRDALNYCQYSFKSLSDMEAFSTEISEFYNDFLNKDFVIKQVLPDKIFVYITPKSSARELSITEIDKIAKKYGNLDAFERIRAYAYPFKTQEQASNFVKELKNIANSKPFSIEQEGALTKVTISNNFRFRNLITNINKNRKIKAIVEKYNGTYKGIGSSSVMVLKNTPYYFESQQKAEAFLEELNDIAKRREYTDINIDDGNTNNSNNYFVLDDFKHTKTGEIYKRAYPIKYVDDFKTLITLAKKAGGFYSRYQSAGFLFATEQQRKSFLDAVNSVNNEEQDISNKLLKSYIGTHKDKESGGTIIGIKVPLNNRNYINYIEPALKKLDYQYVVKKPNNSRYHSALLFKNEKEAKYLLNEIKENIRKDKFNKKYSGVGQMIPSLIDYDNLLTEDKLNRQEKALSDFGKIIGCPILYFNNDKAKNIRGAFSGGIMYLNRASNISPRWTFYHEFIHWLKGTNPEVFAEIRKAIGEVSAKRILEYRDEIVGGNDTFDGKPLLTDEDIIEEMIADHMYNTSTRVSLNKLMAKNNPTIWQRFVAFWHNLLDKFRALYSIPLGLDKEQGKNMNIAMEKLVTSIKNKDGQLLFKRTKNGLVFANNNETVLNNKEFKIKPVSIEVYSSQKEKLSSSKSNGFLDKMKLYWNGRKSTAKPIQIKQALELISGYTFEMGRIQTKDDVVINHVAKIIRTKKAFDYPAMLEAVSPILAEKLGFKNDMAMQQYIANYIFDVASARNDEVNYHKLVVAINNQQMMSEFNHLQSLFSDLKSMSARDKLRENRVSDDNMPKSGLKKLLHEMYLKNHDQWVDRYGPVKRMVDKFEKATGQKLEITNPYKQFRLVAGSAGTGIAFIEGKKGVVNQSLQAIFPNIDFSNFKSLQTILIDNGINKDSEKLEELADYSLAMYYKDNPKNKPSFMKNKDLDEVINTTDDNIKQAHKELIDYQFKLFELMTDAGLISRQQLREMRITHKNYVPMYKYFDENDNLLFRKEITKEENNDRLTVNPIEGVVVNTYKTMRIIAKNKAKLSLTTLANDKMIAPYIKIEQVANKGEDTKTTFSVMINGKKQTYKADKDIIDMMRDLDTETGSNFLKKIIYKISSIMRAVFTISNPEFGFSNFFRDLGSILYYNKYSMRLMDIWHGFSSFFHRDKYYWEYIASGAAQTAAVSMDRNYTQASLNKIYKHSWKSLARWKNLPQDILNIFQYISEASEMGLRIAHYRAGLRKMSVDKSINRQDIAYDTRDIMDFSRGGKAGRELNRYVLFANASIQGWSKFFRDVESYGLKYGLAKGGALLAYKITKYAILPTLILFLLNKDDDKYKETPQWLRDTHWILPLGDKIIRIPKAMEPSILIISSLTERALNYSYNKDKEAFNNAHVLLFDQLPDIFPTLLKPLMETAANYSLFREGNIVPLSKQNDMPYMQYDEHTSGVSKMLGKAFNISPMKMDYLLYGYTGNYGRAATKVLDVSVIPKEYAQKKSSYDNLVSKENLLAWPWEDVVFLRRFMYTPYKNARSLTQFYEDFHYQQALYNEYKDTGVRPKEFNERYYERLKEAQKKMRDVKKMQQKIIDNTTQSANARQSSLDNVNKKRLDIARKALQYK
ncbi:LPD38 domain-containing protein [uncultured Megamonas sp.]|uniref:LPD38 domain-containing protein n=1 Tax=uncultured Megamonas sp. TaxID=286140 RepID=UPI0025927F0B|nr:LPD38 domain-containing protein [uncultured Megamonas sp.]